jgi:hypothetical protein
VVWRLENAEFQSGGLELDLVAQKAVDSIPILRSSILNPQSCSCSTFFDRQPPKTQIDNEHAHEDD